MLPVHEIVVQLDNLRHEAQNPALESYPERRRRLSARRRTGDKHRLYPATLCINLVRNRRIIPLVKRLCHIDQIYGLSIAYRAVQGSDTIYPDHRTPVRIFGQRSRDLGLRLHRNNPVEITGARELQTESLRERNDIEYLQITRRRKQWSMECIYLTVKEIYAADEFPERFEQLRLVRLVICQKKPLRLVARHLFLPERKVSLHERMHLLFYSGQCLCIDFQGGAPSVFLQFRFIYSAIQPAWQRMVHNQDFVRENFPDSILQYKTQ